MEYGIGMWGQCPAALVRNDPGLLTKSDPLQGTEKSRLARTNATRHFSGKPVNQALDLPR